MKRPRRWLEINGHKNVLRNHLVNHGISKWKGTVLAKQLECTPSEIPLEALSEVFGCEVKEAEQPKDWQQILYGSNRGAQKNVPKGKKKQTYAARKERQVEVYDRIDEPVKQFLVMQLNRNPDHTASYY